tara:strand:+ start:162 stop:443 length:282 start_codon:yes stop_codon:yes gene_type:complete
LVDGRSGKALASALPRHVIESKVSKRNALSKGELISLEETVTTYRQCLYDISWLIRNINEHIAREANKEDGCTGRFYSATILGAHPSGQLKLF